MDKLDGRGTRSHLRISLHQVVSDIATLYSAAADRRREESLEYLKRGKKVVKAVTNDE